MDEVLTTSEIEARAVRADLTSARFRAGVARRQWRLLDQAIPIVVVAVAAIKPDGSAAEYSFRFELNGFPGIAPDVRIWDTQKNAALATELRPTGSARVINAFKVWNSDNTVYRPWERQGGSHNNWTNTHPNLRWHAGRDLAFVLEDLHGLLTFNAASIARG
jgi:hypothetical protein